MKKTILLLTLIIGVVNFNFAQTKNKISVKGIARIKEKPELIVVSINLFVRTQDYNTCFQEALSALNELKSEFEKNGIEKSQLKSNEIIVSELYDWEGFQKKSNGFFSRIELEIKQTFSPESSKKLLNSLNAKGLNLSYSIKFDFSETQKEKIRELAIEKAIEDAKVKAAIISKSANLKLTGISNIRYNDSNENFGYLNIEDDELEVVEQSIPITQQDSQFGEIDLNPKEKSISKFILIEWDYVEKE
ncbi:SIMPL domain-containing protein [Gaoshiqia sediminis]|uniref:SIMPL domain-containing protein n=1 Tax=Gaoshiqia sediminis TaxID=2986998 RepID=A0AA41YDT3_9BACT|nr:SIMPL domain-containing protein [Gaoshiqia sediminis]MCW0485048.1 SIMPL domain-containing protein [Gaoshiqia sediminis]